MPFSASLARDPSDGIGAFTPNPKNDMSTVGLMFRNLPAAAQLTAKMKIEELYADVIDQINKGIEHSCYPAIEAHSDVIIDDLECVLYQDNLRELGDMPGLLGEVEIRRNDAASQNVLDLEILNTPEGLQVMLDFASSRYEKTSIEKYRDILGAVTTALLDHAGDDNTTVKTIFSEAYDKLGLGGFIRKFFAFRWLKKQ